MLQINGTWITAHHKGKLYKARQTKPMEEYLKRKYNWSNRTLNDIHWPSIKTTRQKLSHTKQMQTCKIMQGWLPVAHMQHHITRINQCPGCKCTDKTMDHLLQCPHPSLTEQRRNLHKNNKHGHQTKDTVRCSKHSNTNTCHPHGGG